MINEDGSGPVGVILSGISARIFAASANLRMISCAFTFWALEPLAHIGQTNDLRTGDDHFINKEDVKCVF